MWLVLAQCDCKCAISHTYAMLFARSWADVGSSVSLWMPGEATGKLPRAGRLQLVQRLFWVGQGHPMGRLAQVGGGAWIWQLWI